MRNVTIVYDDTQTVETRPRTIIGNNSYGEIVLKRKKMKSYVMQEVAKHGYEFIKINDLEELDKLKYYDDTNIFCHLLSSAAINNSDQFNMVLEKVKFIKEKTAIITNEIIEALIFSEKEEYLEFIDEYKTNHKFLANGIKNSIYTDCLTDIRNYDNLLMYISSGFDARYFNSLHGDNYSITKKSKDKKKMKMEYSYYWLLPEEMKNWMVMPYNYKETKEYASYEMERMPMTDIAIRWTHKAIDFEEFKKILDKTFHFFKIRKEKVVNKEEHKRIADNLYVNKVKDRFEQLKECKEYEQINTLISTGTEYKNIEDIINQYYKLYEVASAEYYKKEKNYKQVIGHGDVFFANMLYSKEINHIMTLQSYHIQYAADMISLTLICMI